MMKLKAGLKRVLTMNLGEIILNNPASTFRAASAAITERLQGNPISPVKHYVRKTVRTYSLQSNLGGPIPAQGDRKLGHGDAIPAEADMIQRCRIDRPVFRRADQSRQIPLNMVGC